MRIAISLAAAALVLGACGSGGGEGGSGGSGNQAADSKEKRAAAAPSSGSQVRLDPGEWEMKMEMNVEGMPAAAASMMQGMTLSNRTCITPEEASKPNADMFSGKKDGNCTYKDYDASGGRLKATIECQEQGTTTRVTMDGTFGGSSMDMQMDTDAAGMKSKMHMTGRRVGECSGSAKS